MGRVIHWEMCKKFEFDHTNKWYMHNPAAVLENDTHKPISDFDIQTYLLISDRKSDLIVIKPPKKKRTCKIMDFAVTVVHIIKLKESEKNDKYLDLAREFLNNMEHEGGDYTNHDVAFCTVTKGLLRGLEDLEVGGWVDTIQTTELLRTARILRLHERGLITTIRNDTDNTIDEWVTTTRKQKWEGKQLYGRFKRLINISHQKTWT